MKKTFFRIMLVILAALLLVSASACTGKGDVTAPVGMVTASDENADFYFFVPKKWIVESATAAVSAYFSKEDPSSVSMMAWTLDDSAMTLEQWWEFNRSELELVFGEFALEKTENTMIDGIYARKYIYTANVGEYSYKFLQAACIKDGEVFLFTYTSLADTFDSHMDDVEQMLSSLKFK